MGRQAMNESLGGVGNGTELCWEGLELGRSRAFQALLLVTPVVVLVTGAAYLVLWRQLRPKFSLHPLTNALLLSCGASSLYCTLGGAALLFRPLLARLLSAKAPCEALLLSHLSCQLWLTPFMSGISCFNFGVFALSLDRALLARRVNQIVERDKAESVVMKSFERPKTSDRAQFRKGAKVKVESEASWQPRVGAIWLLSMAITSVRIVRSAVGPDSGAQSTICALQTESVSSAAFVIAFMVFGNFGALWLFRWASRTCRSQLDGFAATQSHISLSVRVSLRYTVAVTEMLYPAVLLVAVWELLAGLSFAAFFLVSEDLRLWRFALLQYWQCFGMAFVPMMVFPLAVLWRRSALEAHGAGSFLAMASTEPPKQKRNQVGARDAGAAQAAVQTTIFSSRLAPHSNAEMQLRFHSLGAVWGVSSRAASRAEAVPNSVPMTSTPLASSLEEPSGPTQWREAPVPLSERRPSQTLPKPPPPSRHSRFLPSINRRN